MKAQEIREKGLPELEAEILKLRRESFNLRMQRGSGQTIRPHALKAVRRTIARIKTVLREKQAERN